MTTTIRRKCTRMPDMDYMSIYRYLAIRGREAQKQGDDKAMRVIVDAMSYISSAVGKDDKQELYAILDEVVAANPL